MKLSPEEAALEYIRRDSYRSMRYLGGFDYVQMHQEWHNLLNTVPEFALKASTGHAKTTNFLYHCAWNIGVNYDDPDLMIAFFANKFTEAKFRVETIAKIVTSEKYKKLFPWVKPDKNSFNKEYLRFHTKHASKDPQLHGMSFDSEWTGVRVKWAYMDDVVGYKAAREREKQKMYINKFETDLQERLLPDPHLPYIYTPWTKTDLSAHIEKEKLLPVYMYSYRNYEKDGKLLWPSYWTKEAIEKKKNEKPLAWKHGNLLIPLTSEEQEIFDIDSFVFVSNIMLSDFLRPTLGVDLATGRYEESGGKLDRSALTMGFDFRDFKYIHLIKLVDEKVGQLVKIIDDYDQKYNFAEIVFESNAFQYVFGDLLPPHLKRKCKASPTTSNKYDINTGLEAFAEQIKNQKVKFNSDISQEVRDEFELYPFGHHDDAVMSAWIWWSNMCNFQEGRIF